MQTAELGKQILAWASQLARHSDEQGAFSRTYLTVAHQAAATQLAAWMRESGMTVRRDTVGNVIGRYEAILPDAPALLTGSHFDSVRNAGIYDGNLGILLPIACVGAWHRSGRRFPHAVEVIGFAEEEGVRFGATLLGSRALAGTFDMRVLDNVDQDGHSMREAIAASGQDPVQVAQIAYPKAKALAFVEVHIEQGPVLLNENLPLGVVSAISGASRYTVDIQGLAGHAGTVPMEMRRDAATAAAEIALYIETRCSGVAGLVGTVGQFNIPNGAVNVVPGSAIFSIDIRAADDAVRAAAVSDVLAEIQSLASRRRVIAHVRNTHQTGSTTCAEWLQKQWAATLQRLGLPLRSLPSGAGHDAMAMAALTDVAMLFVRCGNGGISHHPDETMSEQDAGLAALAFADFVEHFSPA